MSSHRACPFCGVLDSLRYHGLLDGFVVSMCSTCDEVSFWFDDEHYEPDKYAPFDDVFASDRVG